MDNQRLFLWGSLGLVYFMLYSAWMQDHAPAREAQQNAVTTAEAPLLSDTDDLPTLPDEANIEMPGQPSQAEAMPQAPAAPTSGAVIRVVTDVLDLDINTLGGDISRLDLPTYPVSKDTPDEPVRLLTNSPGNVYLLQAGLRSGASDDEPTHLAQYTTAATEYRLDSGSDTLNVTLEWQSANGLKAQKIYTFSRGGFEIDLTYRVTNGTQTSWSGAQYLQLKRHHVPQSRSMVSVDSYSYRGPVYYDGKKYEKIDPDELTENPINRQITEGWLASIEHHFLGAVVPPPDKPYQYASRFSPGGVYTLSAIGPRRVVAPGATLDYSARLFAGPKLQRQLDETAKGLKLTVDYGFLTIISQPLFAVLQFIHGLVGNWGWSIILLTIMIKLVFYKLTETSGRSMAKMRKLQPRIKALQERYKDDRQAMSQAMMEMYRKEKANPASGCLPILVQMPVFLALYWVLIESVELRQAPFALWITDLSAKDPYFILPALMAIAMFTQQKLNPPPPDPVQAKVMMFLPLVFSVFFAFFPAGLVLYWLVNTVLSVAQQWKINRAIERET